MATSTNNFGITYPAIDDLLDKVGEDGSRGSKYALASYGASRARQIVSYYSNLADGLLENVGPLVDYYAQEKPLSIAMREIDQSKLDLKPGVAETVALKGDNASAGSASTDASTDVSENSDAQSEQTSPKED